MKYIVYKMPSWSKEDVVWQKAHVGLLPSREMAEQVAKKIEKSRVVSGHKEVPMQTKIVEVKDNETPNV